MKRVDIKTGFLCNNNCLFCVQADNKLKGNRSFEEIKNDLISSRGRCCGVVFTGGEVTIRKDFFDLVKLAKDLNYKIIQIQTNGRMFASLDFCKKAISAGATEFSPALHGYCKEQHDYLTRSSGSFNQTVKGIKNLKSLGAYVLTNTVVVKSNYTNIPQIARLLVKLNADQFQFAFVHPMGNAWKNFEGIVPRISLAAPYIHKGLQIGIDAGKSVMAEAMPYCLMKDYEDYVAEIVIPKTEIRGKKHQNTDNFDKQRKEQGKSKFPQCQECRFNHVCEGPWREYVEINGYQEFKSTRFKRNKHITKYLDNLKARGINIPKIKKGNMGLEYLEWIKGVNIQTYLSQHPETSVDMLKNVAIFQGNIHAKQIASITDEEAEMEVKRVIEKRLKELREKLVEQEVYEKTKEVLEKEFPQEFIADLIHSDFYIKNIIIQNRTLCLIDFEYVKPSFLEIDILFNVVDNIDDIFIKEYEKQNPRTRQVCNNLNNNFHFYQVYHYLMNEKIDGLKSLYTEMSILQP